MKTIKGPAIFLAQFAGDSPPYNSLDLSADGRRRSVTRECKCRAGMAASSI